MYRESCVVLENRAVAPGHYVLAFRSKKIAHAASPGQFVQILCSGDSLDPLLPRPFSFLAADSGVFSILYHVVGKGTELISKFKKGDVVPIIGPLGNGFTIEDGRRKMEDGRKKSILVGGGVGIPPLYHLAQTLLKNKSKKKEDIHVFLGARTKSMLLCENEFKKLGVNLSVATQDGSKGLKGYVTALLTSFLPSPISHLPSRIYTCGPTPMLKAVSLIASEFGVLCETSVEVPMACGFGACLGCAIKVRSRATCATEGSAKLPARSHPEELRPSSDEGSNANYRFAIACTEGPVFDGSAILWD